MASSSLPIQTEALRRNAASVSVAADILRSGGVGGIPTETVYGLAADVFQPRALARVFEVKRRPFFDPLIVHIADLSWIERVVREIPPLAYKLAARFWPGPLTLVLPKHPDIPDLATSGLDTVAVRSPRHPLACELLLATGSPLAAPSANLFGRISPTTADHVWDQMAGAIDFVVDGGPCEIGLESTILQVQGDALTLLRPGGVPQEEISAAVPEVNWVTATSHTMSPAAPGMLPQHYAPLTPLRISQPTEWMALIAHQKKENPELRVGILQCLAGEVNRTVLHAIKSEFGESQLVIETLTTDGNLQTAAAGFFAALRRLDASSLHLILAEPFAESGLGRALNDRLKRAGATHASCGTH